MTGPAGIELATARSFLFVPGNRPDRFDKAQRARADAVILDLEDAVAPGSKSAARQSVAQWLGSGGRGVVRINAWGTSEAELDCSALAGSPGLVGLMVPKAESPEMFAAVRATVGPGVPLIALVETALGLHRVFDISAAPEVTRLAFGSIDFSLDVGMDERSPGMSAARLQLVLASRICALPAPIDTVTTVIGDGTAAGDAARESRENGFGGKMCIHPNQVEAVNAGFLPGADELAWARSVLDAQSDAGASQIDGRMIDKPVVDRARRILQGLDGATFSHY